MFRIKLWNGLCLSSRLHALSRCNVPISLPLCLCVYIYIYICIHVYIFVFEQPTHRTFDYVLVADKVDNEQKTLRQEAFIAQLKKKNIHITVSFSKNLWCNKARTAEWISDDNVCACMCICVCFRGLPMTTKTFLAYVLPVRCLKSTSTCWKFLTLATVVEMRKEPSPRQPGDKLFLQEEMLVPSSLSLLRSLALLLALSLLRSLTVSLSLTPRRALFHQSPIRLDGEQRCGAIFRSLQRCSIILKSGFWLDHSRTFTEWSWRTSFIMSAVCLGLLFCWKMNLRPSPRSRVLWSTKDEHQGYIFTLLHSSYPRPWLDSKFLHPKKHLHSIILPPTCFTVWVCPLYHTGQAGGVLPK